jgi:hypothetical protein
MRIWRVVMVCDFVEGIMNDYEQTVKGQTAEQILANLGGTTSQIPIRDYLMVAAQVRVTQGQIEAQYNATIHLVECANAVVASQNSSTKTLVGSVDRLTTSITRASDDSGKLGEKIVWLTICLVAVGLLQALATAWPYFTYAWHH